MMQYDLRQRAVPLGWAPEAIEGIDEAQARRGTTTDGRSGFARLAGAVAHGEAGGVFVIDVSPMARSAEDWRRLLVLGGVAGVAVVDEQRIYDPNDHDAKLLLALKGTMSEAEIHWRRLRLQGARQPKARRGALRMSAPTGYLWGERGFEMAPDEAVQRAGRVVFQRYAVEPSAWAVVRGARQTGVTGPPRRTSADGDSAVEWKSLGVSRIHERSWQSSGAPDESRPRTRRVEPRSATRPWTQTTGWWRQPSNASGRSSSASLRRWSGNTPRPAAPDAWSFRRKIGRAGASWRGIYRRCGDPR